MLQWTYCSYLQHGACYRIISADNIPTNHCCVTSSLEKGVPCTDNNLVKMSSTAVTHTCLFRRVLAILMQVDKVTTDLVLEKLGVEHGTAVAVLKKLIGDRCLVEDEEEGQLKVVKEILVGSVLPKYLGRKGGKTSKQPGTPLPCLEHARCGPPPAACWTFPGWPRSSFPGMLI